ncbi:hypothetical protein SNEBB_009666 [Seison nebaliae]|nr:hypothetical protein SNEBB_009666 [Seison nebaliae]
MPKFALQIKAQLTNITEISIEDVSTFNWYLKFKCCNCGAVSKEFQYFTEEDHVPLKGDRGTANYVVRCRLCDRKNSVSILPDTLTSYSANDEFQTIVHLECRGLEPVDFEPADGWSATNERSTFNDIDFSERDWCEYDEKLNDSVYISFQSHQFQKVK